MNKVNKASLTLPGNIMKKKKIRLPDQGSSASAPSAPLQECGPPRAHLLPLQWCCIDAALMLMRHKMEPSKRVISQCFLSIPPSPREKSTSEFVRV